jgi:thiamine kinase-like enzyme
MNKKFTNLIGRQHIEKFCSVLKISQDEISDIYVNPGRSANNANFVFDVGGKTFLYRIPGVGTEKFSSRKREKLAYKTLEPFKITDEAIFLSEKTGIKISKYYVGSKIPCRKNKAQLAASMRTLKRLHRLGIDFPHTDTLFDRAKRYRRFALGAGGEKYYLKGFDKYLDAAKTIEKNIYKNPPKFCFTHGDASINNILITQQHEHPILIDMEFPAFSDPFEDIATFCVDAEYRKNDILLMLEYYLCRKGSARERYHVLGLSVIAAMMWYSWAAYKCAAEKNNRQFLDFRDDYHSYIDEVHPSVLEAFDKIQPI